MRKVLWCIDQVAVWGGKITSWLSLLTALAVVYEVFMRYVLNLPTVWASESTTLACITLYMFGGAWVFYLDKHVNIELFREKMSERGKAVSDVLTYVFFAIYTGAMAYHSFFFAVKSFVGRETTSTAWDPPLWPFKFVLAFGFSVLFLQGTGKCMRDLYFVFKGERL